MSIELFSIIMLIICMVMFLIFRRRIMHYFDNPFYLFLGLLFISNLGFSQIIQYALRGSSIALPWLYIILRKKGKLRVKTCNVAKLTLGYLVFCLVSSVWSDSPVQTFLKSIELVTDLVVIWELYTYENDKEVFIVKTLNFLMGVSTILLAITMIGFFFVPSFFANTGYSATHTILGIRIGDGLIGANQTGALAVLVFTWMLLLIYKKKIWHYGILVVCVLAMLYSQSRASLVLIPVIVFFRLFKPKSKYKFFYLALILGLCAFAIGKIDLISQYVLRGQASSDIASLSGRKMIWSYAFTYINERPLLGYGFGAGGEMVGRILPGAFNGFQHMHNGVVETLLGTGIIGCAFILLQYFFVGLDVFGRFLKTGLKENLYEIIILLFFAIRTFTSLGVGSWQSLEIIIWYVFLFALSSQKTNVQIAYKKIEGGA